MAASILKVYQRSIQANGATVRYISQTSCLKARSKSIGDKGKKNVTESKETNTVDPRECLKHTTCFGANFLKDGEDPSLKADSEYPEWLRSIGRSDPITDTNNKLYWRQRNKKNSHFRNREMKLNAN